MALTKGTNSYATVVEADTYFTDRLDVAAWTTADDVVKAQALVTATKVLDDIEWIGTAISDNQPLAFPRNGEYFDPRFGSNIIIDSLNTPQRIVNACFELAYHLLNNDGILDDTGYTKQIQVGSINLTNQIKPNLIPQVVRNLIKPLQLTAGNRSWWRAN